LLWSAEVAADEEVGLIEDDVSLAPNGCVNEFMQRASRECVV
jgi:hypothetical protein